MHKNVKTTPNYIGATDFGQCKAGFNARIGGGIGYRKLKGLHGSEQSKGTHKYRVVYEWNGKRHSCTYVSTPDRNLKDFRSQFNHDRIISSKVL